MFTSLFESNYRNKLGIEFSGKYKRFLDRRAQFQNGKCWILNHSDFDAPIKCANAKKDFPRLTKNLDVTENFSLLLVTSNLLVDWNFRKQLHLKVLDR